ncbi:MAG TPA: RsmB/NOP family class I SAM-dependent RNA methyltransferase, partial [Candidatus Saccharimonadales bacterium]|nr:RsmB/NOP family class I SAM-dependent RNA methyltransferase [Candidatus Saccharimonadales bacterium]
TLMETPLYKEGLLYIQSLSSMIPALVLNPHPKELVLDLAAAPGSKTTQMATMMRNTGILVANDISRARMYKLKANVANQSVTNTTFLNLPGQFIWKKYPEYFDRTLVDAPCSLEGRINCYDPKSYQDWSPKKVDLLSQKERFLLRSAISATKPGGIIVYSTCTLSPEENEEVIDWILKKEGDAIDIEPIEIKGLKSDEPIMQWRKQTFNPRIKNTLRIFPSSTMEGFFVAKIRKLKSTIQL